MAATNRFISLNPGHLRVGKVVEGATTTATDYIELRMLTTKADGTTKTNLTREYILKALEVFKSYLQMGGATEFNNVATKALPQPAPGPTIA